VSWNLITPRVHAPHSFCCFVWAFAWKKGSSTNFKTRMGTRPSTLKLKKTSSWPIQLAECHWCYSPQKAGLGASDFCTFLVNDTLEFSCSKFVYTVDWFSFGLLHLHTVSSQQFNLWLELTLPWIKPCIYRQHSKRSVWHGVTAKLLVATASRQDMSL